MESQRVGLDMFKSLLSPDVRSAHLLVFGAAFGSQAFLTFVGAPIIYSELPRQQFGNLMKKLFPTYFSYNGLAAAFLVGSLAWDNAVVRKHPFDIFDATVYQAFTLATVAAANLINALAIGPASYKLQDERHRQEGVEGKKYDDAGVSILINFNSKSDGV
ncbi:hypothetical protein L7F22_053975 [Adiantum nelumboides]|nr:hypothetical protein [Adiantum nelumboides]